MKYKFAALLLFFSLPAFVMMAEDREKDGFLNRIIGIFTKLNTVDTLYIEPCAYRFAGMVQNTNTFQQYVLHARNAAGDMQCMGFSPIPTLKVGPYFGIYCFYLGYNFDVVKLGSGLVTKRTDFNFSMYRKRMGIDLVYQENSGDFKMLRTRGFEGLKQSTFRGWRFDGMSTRSLIINSYYVFNHDRFFYPAAFGKDSKQIRSQGSWIMGLRFDHHNVRFNHDRLPSELLGTADAPLLSDKMKFNRFISNSVSISGGYAYNWVFSPDWLFSFSITPAIGLMHSQPNFNAIARSGIVWNKSRFFAGASLVSNFYVYRQSGVSFTNALHHFSLYAGIRFGKYK